MRIIRNVLIIVLLVIAIGLIFGAVAFFLLNSRNAARPEAIAAMISDSSVEVTEPDGKDWIVFSPVAETPTTGFIIYPGGFVDPVAYAPIARGIAQEGYLVIIDPMPLNLAVLSLEGADDIIGAFPELSTWTIGGHSLGGAMAAEYTFRNPNAIDGLALWAAYPSTNTDLSAFALEAVSVYGDADGVAKIDDILDGANRLPPDTVFVLIPGGNHTQFGHYGEGLQRGDNPASISREEQQQIVVDSTLDMIVTAEANN